VIQKNKNLSVSNRPGFYLVRANEWEILQDAELKKELENKK